MDIENLGGSIGTEINSNFWSAGGGGEFYAESARERTVLHPSTFPSRCFYQAASETRAWLD